MEKRLQHKMKIKLALNKSKFKGIKTRNEFNFEKCNPTERSIEGTSILPRYRQIIRSQTKDLSTLKNNSSRRSKRHNYSIIQWNTNKSLELTGNDMSRKSVMCQHTQSPLKKLRRNQLPMVSFRDRFNPIISLDKSTSSIKSNDSQIFLTAKHKESISRYSSLEKFPQALSEELDPPCMKVNITKNNLHKLPHIYKYIGESRFGASNL